MARWDPAKFSFANRTRNTAYDMVTWVPRDPGNGFTYAIDGATGRPVRSTWPRCGHTCKECWPEGVELSDD